MADSVWVDTDRMGVVTPQVDALAQKTQAARTVLLESLSRLHDAAGVDDAAAVAFRGSHDPTSESVVSALKDFVGITNGVLAGIRTMVHGYTATEQGNTVPRFSERTRTPTVGEPPVAAREMAVKLPSDVPVGAGDLRQDRLLPEAVRRPDEKRSTEAALEPMLAGEPKFFRSERPGAQASDGTSPEPMMTVRRPDEKRSSEAALEPMLAGEPKFLRSRRPVEKTADEAPPEPMMTVRRPDEKTSNEAPLEPMLAGQPKFFRSRRPVAQTTHDTPVETPTHPVLPLTSERLADHQTNVPVDTHRILRSVHERPVDRPVDDLL